MSALLAEDNFTLEKLHDKKKQISNSPSCDSLSKQLATRGQNVPKHFACYKNSPVQHSLDPVMQGLIQVVRLQVKQGT